MKTICFDTVCEGFVPVMIGEEPIKFTTEEEAQLEIDSDPVFYQDCFITDVEEIGHKTIFRESSRATGNLNAGKSESESEKAK